MPTGPGDRRNPERLVSVTLERSVRRMGRWEYPSWHIVQVRDLGASGVDAAFNEPPAAPARTTWPRLPITLHKDAIEGYWYNLSGNVPSVFVVCREIDHDEDDGPRLAPARVTLNHDEAAAHLETDDTVLSIGMPQSLREWLTEFVEQHYKPETRKKRKRAEWGEEEHDAQRPRAQRPVRGH